MNELQITADRSAIVGVIFLTPLLGVTWIIGVFAIDKQTTIFLWLFTLSNSLQVCCQDFIHIPHGLELTSLFLFLYREQHFFSFKFCKIVRYVSLSLMF